jgi:hypothetical protein
MAFVYQPAVFKEIANSMGLADKNLQDQLDSTIVGSGVSQLISSRNRIASAIGDSTISSTDFDASTILGQVFRSKEVGISTSLNTIYSSIITGMNTYFSSVTSKTMRNYYDGKSTATTLDFVSAGTSYTTGLASFRKLYSRIQSEELIYKLYSVTTSGATTSIVPTSYGYSSSFTNSSLEIRLLGIVGAATTFTVSGDTTTGSPLSLSVTVGAGTSLANVGTTQKFYNVSVLGVPASIGTTTVEIWTR